MKKALLCISTGIGVVGLMLFIVYGLSTVVLFYLVNLVVAPAFHLPQISWFQALALSFVYQLIQGLFMNAGKSK